jgi:hypothetical protein
VLLVDVFMIGMLTSMTIYDAVHLHRFNWSTAFLSPFSFPRNRKPNPSSMRPHHWLFIPCVTISSTDFSTHLLWDPSLAKRSGDALELELDPVQLGRRRTNAREQCRCGAWLPPRCSRRIAEMFIKN